MTSQLLFGETFDIVEKQGSWNLIKNHFDGYEGWVSGSMISPLDENSFNEYKNKKHVYLKDPVCKVCASETKSSVTYLAGGSTLVEEKDQIILGDHILCLENNAGLFQPGATKEIISTAFKFLNAPYLWGGRTVFGFDCSGFTQVVFKINGMALQRDAYQQAAMGKTVTLEEAKPCDLAFFENDQGRIMHVGIILEKSEIIHCSGKVHIDRLDQQGIFNYRSKEYTHKLRIIKRIL